MPITDYNQAATGASIIAKTKIYSDLNIAMPIHPVRSDITPLKDIDAVKQAVKNLILTNYYERPFHPEIGSGVTSKLFNPADSFTAIEIQDEIELAIRNFEPRVNQLLIEVYDISDSNSFLINIGFNVIYLQQRVEVSFNLIRLR